MNNSNQDAFNFSLGDWVTFTDEGKSIFLKKKSKVPFGIVTSVEIQQNQFAEKLLKIKFSGSCNGFVSSCLSDSRWSTSWFKLLNFDGEKL